MTILLIVGIILFSFVVHRAGYDIKLLEKLGIIEHQQTINWTVNGWETSLGKMNYDADIVFFGDSITAGSDFQAIFTNQKIVELGIPGDSIIGMSQRIGMVKALTPEKVFVLGGINGLTDMNSDKVINQYRQLIASLKNELPSTEIYVQSVLPISDEKESSVCHNNSIVNFNNDLIALCNEQQVTYIDLFSLYEKDGSMNPDLTKDGIHLKPEAYSIWAEKIKEYIE